MYPQDDIESDEDEPLSVMKRRDLPKAEDNDTPAENTPSSQELRESGGGGQHPSRRENASIPRPTLNAKSRESR